jgi:transcriptional regulator with XRE-family HTH domain
MRKCYIQENMMQEQELRALFSANIKKFRNRRGWSQLNLAEKLDISSNFLSEIETGKGWVSPLTLVKIANALEIEVFELFQSGDDGKLLPAGAETETLTRFAKDMSLALDLSVNQVAKTLKQTVENVYKEYLT